jgi:RNA polymerase sigma factor (sigma-70 family)
MPRQARSPAADAGAGRGPDAPPDVPPDAPPDPRADAPPPAPTLGELLEAMRSGSPAVREAAWAACFERYHRMVWTRAFYVMRSIAWLAEPREAAADVASDVFVGLPDAVRQYRETGRAEWWLSQVTVRTALRRKEALTGTWVSGRTAAAGAADAPAPDDPGGAGGAGRSFVAFEETADGIVARHAAVEPEELLELQRRRDALRDSPDEGKRRWHEFVELYLAGYDFKEIGARMGLTEGSARNWLCRIRKHLAQPPGER